ncbi:YjbQ family protein [Legionella israelensis]|uniref:YjbQ family protein n=1 Tax=Legionella israelensis TaxID=454 RepID=A0AAX1EEI5_9GAMM|nr:secondary thiamine-phosphate synthase enzyme YjbQ [Legionella israelensis]QBR83521.1 YjbQ family protein [Legionella israelensis]
MAEVKYWQVLHRLPAKPRGFHLITHDVIQALKSMPAIETGIIHLFIQHTSASLCINENTCEDVRLDLEAYFNRSVPEDNHLYRHILEGEDDMPAHIKNVLLGASLNIPLIQGKPGLGQWQGIYLCEHRNEAPSRNIVITVHGV